MATATKMPGTIKKAEENPAVKNVEKDAKPFQAFFTKFMNDWSMNLSAALAYNLLMAIFPIALATLAILGFVLNGLNPAAYQNLINNQLPHILPQQVGPGVVEGIFQQLKRASGIIAIVAIVLAIFNGSRLFILIEGCFGIIYHVRQRTFIPQNIMAISMLLLFIVLIPVMVFVSALPTLLFTLLKDTHLSQIPGSGFIFGLGGIIGGLIAAWILFLATYIVVPNQHISFRNSWLGALVAALALEAYLALFPVYVSHFLNGVGGSTGFAIILLVFFYYFALILLLGAEVNAFFAEKVESTPYDLVTMIHLTTSHLPKSDDERKKQAAASHKDSPGSNVTKQDSTDGKAKQDQKTVEQVSKLANIPGTAAAAPSEQQQVQPAQEDHASIKDKSLHKVKEHKPKKTSAVATSKPSMALTVVEAVAGTALAFAVELIRMRRKK